MSSLSLAQQLKQLQSNSADISDPDSAYSSLDSHKPGSVGNNDREHYLDVGPSKLRMQVGEAGGGTLAGPKYEGVKTGRNKIFDDDDDESEAQVEDDEYDDESVGHWKEEDEDNGEEDEDMEKESEEENYSDEAKHTEEEYENPMPKASQEAFDPIASLKTSRLKDIQKGHVIQRQKALFESLITLRITFQKALTASNNIPLSLPVDPENEIATKKEGILQSLSSLSERLFILRESIQLFDDSDISQLGKRKRAGIDEYQNQGYWLRAAEDSFGLADRCHLQLLPILNKWSNKIQAASLQLGSKQAGGSKFLQQMKNSSGSVLEIIEAGLNNKRETEKTLLENEETGYRALLREVIESRSCSRSAVDLSHLRREKKKKREAERGGSKGRKLRYTAHEKAQNFVVPVALSHGWHEEQVDELFASLFGGAGMKGATTESVVGPDVGNADEGLAELNGLRVF
ncbi:hypothetical protein L204_104383 [Cryptococcus depauperatus]|nr:protein BFR2 [Cryptococcus depauperatus CBS 7855]